MADPETTDERSGDPLSNVTPLRTPLTERADADDAAEASTSDDGSISSDDPVAPRRRRPPRIAPHAARAASRSRRTWVALAFFPFFAIYLIYDGIRELRDMVSRARSVELERDPPFTRPRSMPPLETRSMEQIVSVVESFPFRPAPLSASRAFFRDNGPDALGSILSLNPNTTTIPHVYPRQFEQRLFHGEDRTPLAGMQAMHEHVGPAVVICHGLLMTKNFDAIIQLAKRAFAEWGFHVVTLDLRGWGQSSWTSDAPSSAGYHEGRDIVEICRTLHEDPRVTSVAAIGYSLGGASVLNAAHVSSRSQDRPLDGGAVAVSAPSNMPVALRHISTRPHWRDPFFGVFNIFDAAIRNIVRRRGLPRSVRTWRDLLENIAAPWYGIETTEFIDRASAVNFAHEIDQPVLELHSADDFLVPVEHAYALQDATVDNPWVHVMIRDLGAHVSFAAVDASWYHSVLRRWLEFWATPGPDPDAGGPETPEAIAGG